MLLRPHIFELQLNDGPDHRYSPGDTIAGRVIVEFKEPKSIRSIKVRFKGKGNAFLGDGEEQYLYEDLYVLGRAQYSPNTVIQGYRVFKFKFHLPRDIPSSFKSFNSKATIKYTAKAIMDAFWTFCRKPSITFAVATPFDLSQCPSAMIAMYDEDYKTFRSFSGSDMGAMDVKICLPVRGFTIGEAIRAKIDVKITSPTVVVTKVKLRLEQVIKLLTKNTPIPRIEVVKNVKQRGPFGRRVDIDLSMEVPSLPYSKTVYSGLIEIGYCVRVTIIISGYHNYILVDKRYPIWIGTKQAVSAESIENQNLIPAPYPVGSPTHMMPMPYPMPLDEEFSKTTGNGSNAFAPDDSNIIPNYSFMPGNEPYPPTMRPIGFVLPSPTEDRGVTKLTDIIGLDRTRSLNSAVCPGRTNSSDCPNCPNTSSCPNIPSCPSIPNCPNNSNFTNSTNCPDCSSCPNCPNSSNYPNCPNSSSCSNCPNNSSCPNCPGSSSCPNNSSCPNCPNCPASSSSCPNCPPSSSNCSNYLNLVRVGSKSGTHFETNSEVFDRSRSRPHSESMEEPPPSYTEITGRKEED